MSPPLNFLNKENPFLRVRAGFIPPEGHKNIYDDYIRSIQRLIGWLLPQDIIPFPSQLKPGEKIESYFEAMMDQLPIVRVTEFEDAPCSISIVFCCSGSKYTIGVGRYMCDLFSLWVIPGKQVLVGNFRSLNVRFIAYPQEQFVINEVVLNIEENRDVKFIKHRLAKLIEDLKITFLAVYHARRLASNKSMTHAQKKLLIQENVTSLLNRFNREIEGSIFEQVQQLLLKATGEKAIVHLQEQIIPLLEMGPEALEPRIFQEMQHFVLNLRDRFTATRTLQHINRIVSYHYLLRKALINLIQADSSKRHINLKILRSRIHEPNESYPICGILIALNFIKEHEIFEQRHLFKAVQACVPGIELVPHSNLVDLKPKERMRTLYFEVRFPSRRPFTTEEVKNLKKHLIQEVKSQIENVIHPLFIHRNDEEIMRHTLELSKELKYSHDLPQVMINFHKQTGSELSFLIILLRILKPQDPPLKEVLKKAEMKFKIVDHECKLVGMLRKRYAKEANILEVCLNKKQFLRKDYSLDLYKARLKVLSELSLILGEVRDYNGGIISKQYEGFSELKALLDKEGIKNDFLLENYFYGITPPHMQSLLNLSVLNEHFGMLLDLVETADKTESYALRYKTSGDRFLIFIASHSAQMSEELDKAFDAAHLDLILSKVQVYDLTYLGIIKASTSSNDNTALLRLIRSTLDPLFCTKNADPLIEV